MISAPEIAAGLQGAGRLAVRDTSGLGFMNATLQGFWRSFVALFLAYPAYLILVINRPGAERAGQFDVLLVETIAYVIGWLAFPVVMVHITDLLGRGERFLGYIVAVNWCNVIQAWLIASIALLGAANALPQGLARFLSALAFLWTLSFQWFVARAGLAVNGLTAAAVVALDVVLSLFVMSVSQSIQGG